MSESAIYRFGVFEFDSGTRELRRNGGSVALEPQPARALALLLARAGEVISREELKAAVWGPETHVEVDRGLAYVMSQIRGALGDRAENPRFVQTLPRRGYKFIAPVHSLRHDAPASAIDETLPATDSVVAVKRNAGRWWMALAAVTVTAMLAAASWMVWSSRAAATPARALVGVALFDNETGSPDYDRLVAGLSDLVVARLTALAPDRVGVIGNARILRQPRNIRNLKAVRAELDAEYVLLGQLQRAESGLRFITHFIRLSDEAHLRANRLSYPDGDLSRLESDVVAEFERAVRQHVLGGGADSREVRPHR